MQISFVQSIHQVESREWNPLWPHDHPFTRHEFFAALEDSGSTRGQTGWQPHHMLVRINHRLVAATPLFLKGHSYGEYVFDWAWADAYAQQGMRYYPKLVNAIPFTPTTGPRLGLAADLTRPQRAALVGDIHKAIATQVAAQNCSGWHCLFPHSADQAQLTNLPLIPRFGCQFHWFNRDYTDFDDFLQTFTSRKRKQVKRERMRVADAGLHLHRRSGDDVSAAQWREFYGLYQRTYIKRSGSYGYLGPSFFERLAKAMPDRLLLVSAHRPRSNEMVAGAFFLHDHRTLYGRYWGATEEFDGLHFEACFYQGIEHAIALGLARFDPGAQGEHKIQRGFTPVRTCSYHWLADTRFAHAVAQYCEQEAHHIGSYIASARELLPFREGTALVPADALMAPHALADLEMQPAT